MERPLAPDEATTSVAAAHGLAAAASSVPPVAALSERRARSWFRYAFNWVFAISAIIVLCCLLYGLSLGPVLWYYKAHPVAVKPGIAMYTLKNAPGGWIEESRRSVHFPDWIASVYSPMFRLSSAQGERGLGSLYRRYLFWSIDQKAQSIDQKAQCLRNLRRLDEAKRKWALETKKMGLVSRICGLSVAPGVVRGCDTTRLPSHRRF
jgi:hypothetical protein